MKRYIGATALFLLLTPGAGFAASKEQQEMQRDIAQLQDQVQRLQSAFDQQIAAIRTLVEQALDAGNKTSTNLSVLANNITQTLDRDLKDSLRPVAGLSAKVDNANNDLSDIRTAMGEITSQLNRLQTQLNDVNNTIKVMQAPPAAPPPPAGSDPSAGGVSRVGAPPSPKQIFDNASADYSSGKADLAAGEFADFVRLYPDDPRAPEAQFYVGLTHYGQSKYDQAVMDFDAVLERFPENSKTPDAYFMKGKALKANAQRDAAAKVWNTLIKKYPHSDLADQAAEQLKAMGLRPTSAVRKK
jgi:tol-pal system protein YbgF